MRQAFWVVSACIVLLVPVNSWGAGTGTRLYLHNFGAPVSGYLHASTQPGALLATASTTTTGGATNIQLTQTEGGAVLSWISPPLASPVVISGTQTCNLWGQASSSNLNTGLRCRAYRYSAGSSGNALWVADATAGLTTDMANRTATGTFTSTAFSAGDRIRIDIWIENCANSSCPSGTMGSGVVTFDFDGPAPSSDGDSWVSFTETLSFIPEPEVIQAVVSNTTASDTFNITIDPSGEGNLLIVAVAGQNQDNYVTGVADNRFGGSNTYTRIAGSHATVNLASPCTSTTGFTDIFYAPNSLSGATTVTVTMHAPAADAEMWVLEVANLALAGLVDSAATAAINSQIAGSANQPGPSIKTAGSPDFLIAVDYLSSQVQNALFPWAIGPPVTNGNGIAYTTGPAATYQPVFVSNDSTGPTDCYAIGTAGFRQTAQISAKRKIIVTQ